MEGVSPFGVVERFDVFEDRLGELPAGLPPAPVEQFELQGPKKLAAMALSRASPPVPIDPRRPAWRSRCPNAQLV
jgi:hypothetical protein